MTGGYLDAAATPTPALLGEFKFVDASIAAFVDELKAKGLYDSTLIVITAKHGQSPIDPSRYIPQKKNGTTPATLLSKAGYIPLLGIDQKPHRHRTDGRRCLSALAEELLRYRCRRQDPRRQCFPNRNRAGTDLFRPHAVD